MAVAVAGCGGGHEQPEQQRIVQALRSYLRAQAAGQGQAACALLTPSGQDQLIALVIKESKGLIKTRPSCEEAVSLIRAVAGENILSALTNAQIEHVQVQGEKGSAEVIVDLQPAQTVSLEKVGTAWKIVALPGLAH